MQLPKDLITQEKNYDGFIGSYKNHEICIALNDNNLYYTIVKGPDGLNTYDGWAPASVGTIDQAIMDALEGSKLLPTKEESSE